MKTLKTFETFLGGDIKLQYDPDIVGKPGYLSELQTALKWWKGLSKEEKREIESKQGTLAITDSNIKRLYKIYNK